MKETQEKILIGVGVWLLVLPFTGFPRGWKTVLTLVSGAIVVYIGTLLWRATKLRKIGETKTGTFTETIEPPHA